MQRSISGRAWDVVAGFEVAYATTAGDQIGGVLVMDAAHAATVARLTPAPPQLASGSDSCPVRVKA
jgi:hypothetical protein